MRAKPSKDERSEKFEQNDIQDHQETPSDAAVDDSSAQTDALPKTYFEEECYSACHVIGTVIEDVRDILRKHGYHVAESCLWSAYNAYSSFSQFAIDDLREGRISDNDREEIHLDIIRGSSLQELQEEADDEEVMLRFLLDGMNSEGPYREAGRSRAIEYVCDKLNRLARGLVYHTSSERRNEAASSAS